MTWAGDIIGVAFSFFHVTGTLELWDARKHSTDEKDWKILQKADRLESPDAFLTLVDVPAPVKTFAKVSNACLSSFVAPLIINVSVPGVSHGGAKLPNTEIK